MSQAEKCSTSGTISRGIISIILFPLSCIAFLGTGICIFLTSCASQTSLQQSLCCFPGWKKEKEKRERDVVVRVCIRVFHRLKGVLEHGQVWTITAVCEHVSAYPHTRVNMWEGSVCLCVICLKPQTLDSKKDGCQAAFIASSEDLLFQLLLIRAADKQPAAVGSTSEACSSPMKRDCREDPIQVPQRESRI